LEERGGGEKKKGKGKGKKKREGKRAESLPLNPSKTGKKGLKKNPILLMPEEKRKGGEERWPQ